MATRQQTARTAQTPRPRAARTRRGLAAFIAAALALVAGCGQEFHLPPQPPPGRTPEPGTYNLWAVWQRPHPTDLAVFGLYLFVIEEQARVAAYYSARLEPQPIGMVSAYEDLIAPVQIAVSKRDSLFVVVADSADMRCKVYYWLGGPPLYSFSDPRWKRFSGLAADRNLTIYVADAERDTVAAYDRWGHRLRVVSDYGTGFGYVIDPQGMMHNGDMLVVADTGKDLVQRLDSDTTNIAALPGAIGEGGELLMAPADVATDRYGEFIYVADTGHDRVLKFLTTGAFQDTVYSHAKIDLDPPLFAPRYLCSEDALEYFDEELGTLVDFRTVYVSDPELDRILLIKLANW